MVVEVGGEAELEGIMPQKYCGGAWLDACNKRKHVDRDKAGREFDSQLWHSFLARLGDVVATTVQISTGILSIYNLR